MTTLEKTKIAVIEAIHWLPYEEAVRRELWENWEYKVFFKNCTIKLVCNENSYKEYLTWDKFIKDYQETSWGDCYLKENSLWRYSYEILWLPITLGRVLQALENTNEEEYKKIHSKTWETCFDQLDRKTIALDIWKLTKENGQECTLEDQTEETIEAIHKLLTS